MKKIIYYSFLASSFLSIANASEDAHHGPSIMDLKYPVLNFIVLAFILSKVVKPLREKFNKNADEVKSLMDSAARNNKDAEMKLNEYQEKINKLDSEIAKIAADYEAEAKQFAKNQSEETQAKIVRMKRDLENKLEGEKTELMNQLNQDLINKVVSSTQATIKGNKDFQVKATQKIVSELR